MAATRQASIAGADASGLRSVVRPMLNKVPEVTLYFWVIKVLCTTVGETAADFLNGNLGLGLTDTTFVMSAVLAVALVFQFRLRRYVPGVYWLAVVLISVVGTLITDNLTDNFGVSLVTTTIVFSFVLAATFAAWYWSEKTLSIHTIVTTRREAFYWLAVLFTFALGTAAGDLTAERFAIGYWQSALIFGGLIAVVYVAHVRFALNAVLAFWVAYILTRPLGASIGDYLSQPVADGGRGLGTTVTSVVFLLTILGVVVFLTVTRRDVIKAEPAIADVEPSVRARVLVVANKTAATSALVEAVRVRAAAGPAEFVMLVPNPAHLAFDRIGEDTHAGDELLARALPTLEAAAGSAVEGRVATSPNAFDDIVAELAQRSYSEIILETLPRHVSHWLHVDLAQRLAHLGYPLTTVTATADGGDGRGNADRAAGAVIAEDDTAGAVIDPQVVVLEDDPELRSLLVRGLREEGFHVTTAASAAELLDLLPDRQPAALVVDIGLPDADGRDVVQALRAHGFSAPVIFLTARDALTDRLAGFAAGGDDYLTKPFAFAELVARLNALIKRGGADLSARVGHLRLDPGTHAASSGGTIAELTPTEFRILARLAARPGDAVRRRQLIEAAWPHGAIVHDNTLDVYIARIRRKIASLPDAPEIATVHGVGYSLR